MSNEIHKLYKRFKIELCEDGEQAHQMELARRRYKDHKSKPNKPAA